MKQVLFLLTFFSGFCQAQVLLWKADSSVEDSVLMDFNRFVFAENEAIPLNLGEIREMIYYPSQPLDSIWDRKYWYRKFIFKVLVNESGQTVAIVRLLPKKTWKEMDDIFLKTLKKLIWKPATLHGREVKVW
ncbi:MAG: hypothetical protein R3B47_16685, partial [Bacteroidia bacterium]